MDWGNRKESLRYASATITDSGVPKSLTLDSLTTVQHGGIPIKQLVQLNIKENRPDVDQANLVSILSQMSCASKLYYQIIMIF